MTRAEQAAAIREHAQAIRAGILSTGQNDAAWALRDNALQALAALVAGREPAPSENEPFGASAAGSESDRVVTGWMIMDDSGNALGAYDTHAEGVAALRDINDGSVGLIGYDAAGIAVGDAQTIRWLTAADVGETIRVSVTALNTPATASPPDSASLLAAAEARVKELEAERDAAGSSAHPVCAARGHARGFDGHCVVCGRDLIIDDLKERLAAAEARVKELEAALRDAQQWDLSGAGEARLAAAEARATRAARERDLALGVLRDAGTLADHYVLGRISSRDALRTITTAARRALAGLGGTDGQADTGGGAAARGKETA